MKKTLNLAVPAVIFLIYGVSCHSENRYSEHNNQVIRYLDECSTKVNSFIKSHENNSKSLNGESCEKFLSKDTKYEEDLDIKFSIISINGRDYSINIEDQRGMKFSNYTSLAN